MKYVTSHYTVLVRLISSMVETFDTTAKSCKKFSDLKRFWQYYCNTLQDKREYTRVGQDVHILAG